MKYEEIRCSYAKSESEGSIVDALYGGPYPVQSRRMQIEPFESEKEATAFATDLAMEIMIE